MDMEIDIAYNLYSLYYISNVHIVILTY